MSSPSPRSKAWEALDRHAGRLRDSHLRDLFAADPGRFEALSCRIDGALFDFSKQRITTETRQLLVALAEAADVEGWRDRLFAGARVNTGEGRAALHPALRANPGERYPLDGEDVMAGVLAERERLSDFSAAIREGRHTGFAETPIRHVVNLGIGGSDLGPRMACEALSSLAHPSVSVHFVANVDGADLAGILERLDPRATLFVVASKTFTTIETLTNARSARNWLLEAAGEVRDLALARHFVAVTANPQGAIEFGIAEANCFAFADWVGGRFSLWSPIGLPLALSIGYEAFARLLAGGRRADQHFRETPLDRNVPVLMALYGLWNRNFLGSGWQSIVPYSQALRLLPAYLQQLMMESNGKSVDRDGRRLPVASAPAVFGDAGTNAQHAYFQWLHQGPRPTPTDFVAFSRSEAPLPGHHEQLLANCLAQSAALAFGDSANGDPHRACEGNQPSTTMLLPKLDPFHLGLLVALYEHQTFVQGVLWGINPFDQWGVELGKRLARRLLPLVADSGADETADAEVDASTTGLLRHLQQQRSQGG